MAKGNTIIVSGEPQGKFSEAIIGDTSPPGTFMQIQAGTAPISGRHTVIAAAVGTDGKCIWHGILLEDREQGKNITDAYVLGTRGRIYTPVPGEELNALAGEVAGTGNSYTIGDRLEIDAETGILVPESGSPQETIAVAMETVSQVVGSTLLWVKMMS